MRETILRGLGWTIERVWSTDWFQHRKVALDRLDAALRAHLDTVRQSEVEMDAFSGEDKDRVEEPDEIPVEPTQITPTILRQADLVRPEPFVAQAASLGRTTDDLLPLDLVPPRAKIGMDRASESGAVETPDPDAFFDPEYTPVLNAMIDRIVSENGPVHFDALAREIASRHGWSRVGGRIRARVESCTSEQHRTEEASGTFLWPSTPEAIISWRGANERDPSEIPLAEIAGLQRQRPEIALSEDPPHTLSRALGRARLSKGRRDELQAAIEASWERCSNEQSGA